MYIFICCVQVLKTNVKLNVKKLYQADRNAVGELLRITDVLDDALNINKTKNEGFSKLDTNLTYNVFCNFILVSENI